MTFEVWWSEYYKTRGWSWDGAAMETARAAWKAGQENMAKTGPADPEPEVTPTEMVKALLEKGWEVNLSREDATIESFYHPSMKNGERQPVFPLHIAYRKALPRKVENRVEAWRHKNGSISTRSQLGDEYRNPSEEELIKRGWTKGTAIFYVEEA